tara:strand:- start:164 stop:820 length:657 start_codon:yes stop_codon:yes gene_type:complete
MRTLIVASPSSGSSEFKRSLAQSNNYDSNFGEIFNPGTFKTKLAKEVICSKEWMNFCLESNLVLSSELIAQFQINAFEKTTNSIAKVFPTHLNKLGTKDIIKYISKLCGVANKIYYMQRENKKEQIVSRSVRFINGNGTGHPDDLKKLMYTYKGDLSDDVLNENFDFYQKEVYIINEIYKKYPGEVITLERDIEDTTSEGRYVYTGDWELPEELPLLK